MPQTTAPNRRIVPATQWRQERIELLAKEKEHTRQREELARLRRELPWVRVEREYTFDGPTGKVSLADLFAGRGQLIVYHFMFDPAWSQGCKSCSFIADHFNPSVVHLQHRDTSLVSVSKAPIGKIEAFRERMGWTFPWVSSFGNDFNRDFGVSFTDEELRSEDSVYNFNRKPYPIRELPGMSAFIRGEDGTLFHTYSTYARGLDIFLNAYNLLDITAKGRDEVGVEGMAWLRHHDRYDDQNFVDPWNEKPAAGAGG